MIKKRTEYETSDGQTFYSESLAEAHEEELRRSDPLWRLIHAEGNEFCDEDYNLDYRETVFDWIKEHAKEIKEML